MKQVVQNYRTGALKVEEVPPPVLGQGGVLLRNRCSLISAGTERLKIDLAQKSLLGKAQERPDLVRQVINKVKQEGVVSTYQKVMTRLDALTPLGYSCAGVVVEVGRDVKGLKPGDRVACGGAGYASHAEMVFVPRNLCVRIPEGVDFEEAAFVSLGAIAMQGVRRAEITLGERVAVIGLGLVGQIAVQILKAYGSPVLGLDIDAHKVALALDLGADSGVTLGEDDVMAAVSAFSEGVGADAVLITAATKSDDPVELAAQISRDRGRVVVVGAVGMNIPRKPYYDKELDLRLSRSYGPGRYDPLYEEKGVDYPIGYIRWTERRNMEAFLDLLAQGKVRVRELITHRFPIAEAERAYDIVMGKVQEKHIGILLQYDAEGELDSKVFLPRKVASPKGDSPSMLQVGLIGAGNFARGVLLPNLAKVPRVRLRAVATATGLTARHVAEKFGADYCSSDHHQLLQDPDLDWIIIATRHNLHAPFAAQALREGKHVFVEKPLALSIGELRDLMEAWREAPGKLMVGYNRRFSPLAREVKDFYRDRTEPLMIDYRVNAGFIPRDHWVHDSIEGGGRVVGEVCHFVDFLQFLTEADPIRVYAQTVTARGGEIIEEDNLFVHLAFSDGSIGCIGYSAGGDKSFSKERIEVFGGGSVAVIDDFRAVTLAKGGKEGRRKGLAQDKGHRAELQTLVDSILADGQAPIDFRSLVLTSLTTFKILQSIQTGSAMSIDIGEIQGDETAGSRESPPLERDV